MTGGQLRLAVALLAGTLGLAALGLVATHGEEPGFLLPIPNGGLNAIANLVPSAAGIVLVVIILARLVRRWWTASPPARRVLAPVAWTGPASLVLVAVTIGLYAVGVSATLDRVLQWST